MTERNEIAFDRYKHLLTTHPYDTVMSHEIVEKTDSTVTVRYELLKNSSMELTYTIVCKSDVERMRALGEKINLDRCYLEEFDCIKWMGASDGKPILKGFSAECAFFWGKTDFTGAQFQEGDVSFLGTTFKSGDVKFDTAIFNTASVSFEKINCGYGKMSFSHTDFGDSEVSFVSAGFGDGGVVFDGARFGAGSTTFKNAIFGNGNVSFVETQFGDGDEVFDGAQFGDGEIWFGRSVFGSGKVSFEKTNFGNGDVSFWETDFGQGATSFNKAVFGQGEVSFCGTNFGDDYVWFDDADFGVGSVSFMGTQFGNSNVRFYRTNFEDGDVTFFGSTFGECEVRFWKTSFGNREVNFTSVMASQATITFIGCNLLNHEIFRFKTVKRLELIDCIIDGVLLLNSEKREMVQIEELSFLNTKNLGSIFVDWETAKHAIANYQGSSADKPEERNRKKANQLKMLKENFHNLGEYDSEDEAFAEYMNYRRKTQPHLLRFPSWVLSAIAGYGTRPVRLFITMLMVIAMFGFLFSGNVPFVEMVGKEELSEQFFGLARGIYFSMITFMTIGYGDISPSNVFTAFLAGLEGFSGLFLMSYFTVSVVRKTLR